MLPPPTPQHPLSGAGRAMALHPLGRIPVTPPAIAGLGGLPLPASHPPIGGDAESDDFMDIGEPDNP
eukprot:2471993-Amphidinium_carterae.1